MSDGLLSEVGVAVARHDGILEVAVSPRESCGSCRLCRRADDLTMRVEVRDDPSIPLGSAVRVTFPFTSNWKPILVVFALPLLLFFAFAACGSAVARLFGLEGPSAVAAVIGGFLGLGAGLAVGRMFDRRFRRELLEKTRVELL